MLFLLCIHISWARALRETNFLKPCSRNLMGVGWQGCLVNMRNTRKQNIQINRKVHIVPGCSKTIMYISWFLMSTEYVSWASLSQPCNHFLIIFLKTIFYFLIIVIILTDSNKPYQICSGMRNDSYCLIQ